MLHLLGNRYHGTIVSCAGSIRRKLEGAGRYADEGEAGRAEWL